MTKRVWPLAILAILALACKKHEAAPPPATLADKRMCTGAGETVSTSKETAPEVTCSGGERQLLCYGEWAAHCGPDDKLVKLTNCRAHGQVCSMHKCTSAKDCVGCQSCRAGTVLCGDAGERMLCRDDGSGYDMAEVCDEAAGLRCSTSSGLCQDLCAAAEAERSYVGCDYWAVPTINSQLAFDGQDADGICQPFSFAVVVANAEGVTATVTIKTPGQDARTVTVEPSDAITIELPCAPELKGVERKDAFSARSTTAAHHITSDVPITVYQFNPLEFQSVTAKGDTIYSYTGDASLLLPVSSLTGDYVVITQPTLKQEAIPNDSSLDTITRSGPGFVAMVGVESAPTEIEIVSSAYTRASEDGMIPALAPGDHYSVQLAQGEVLQLLSAVPDDCPGNAMDSVFGGTLRYCKVSKEYDLTGTQIKTPGKVGVISGHDCVFLPYNRWACDHIEESMFPTQSWGKDIVVSISETVACQDTIPNIVRILSGADGNHIDFAPSTVHASLVLDKGEFVEFEVKDDFRLVASSAVLVAQFLLGQDYNGRRTTSSFLKGDPSMSLAIPVEQWRKRYPFLIPETFSDNYVNVIARAHQLVLLDDRVVSGFVPIKGTKNVIARVPLQGGRHFAESAQPFGIVLYGYAPFTSYMMPGGLDLTAINDLL
jgi:hypothetical protein